MSVYLDTSVLLPLFTSDVFTARASAGVGGLSDRPLVSDLARAEFASVCALRVRTGIVERSEAEAMFGAADTWLDDVAQQIETRSTDIRQAELFLRRADLTLRAPDAIHLAVVARLRVPLATFDQKMAICAQVLGLPVATM